MATPERNVWSDHILCSRQRCVCKGCGAKLLRPAAYPDPPALVRLIEEDDPPAIEVAKMRAAADLWQSMDTVWHWVLSHRGCRRGHR